MQLKQVKREINTQKLEAVKTEAKTAILSKVGSFLGTGKIKDLEQENKTLHEEVAARDESIEKLQSNLQNMEQQHNRQLLEIQQKHISLQGEQQKEISILKKWIDKACKWFPLFADVFRMERLCRSVGFTPEQTDRLLILKPMEYSGALYSEEHRRKFDATQVSVRIVIEPTDKRKFALHINGQSISDWFKEQFGKLRYSVRQSVQPQKENKGMKL